MKKGGKEIVLLILAVALVVIVGMSLVRRSAPPSAVPEEKVSEEKSAKAKQESAKSNLPTAGSLLGTSPGNSPNRNPFAAPSTAAPVAPVTAAPTTPGSKAAAAATQTGLAGIGSLPPFPAAGVSGPLAAPAVLQLKGISYYGGKAPMAILRKGEQHYFVMRGERVEGIYTVTNIGSDRVTLQTKDGNKIILQMGGGA